MSASNISEELEALRKRAEESLPAYPGDTERLMTVPAPTVLRLLDLLRVATGSKPVCKTCGNERMVLCDIEGCSQSHPCPACNGRYR